MSPSPLCYRVMWTDSSSLTDYYHYDTLKAAYTACVVNEQTHWHIRLLPSLREELESSNEDSPHIRVSYNDTPNGENLYLAAYIQVCPRGPNTPSPNLATPDGT